MNLPPRRSPAGAEVATGAGAAPPAAAAEAAGAAQRRPALAVVLNRGSGHRGSAEREALLRDLLHRDGRPHCLLPIDAAHPLPAAVAHAVQWASERQGAVVVSGGDGTLNAVAQAALPAGCPVGVVADGTFNYFARGHGLPTEPEAALRAVLAGHVRPVQAGLLNGRVFLVNASVGLYPRLLEDREAFKQRFGRYRLNALFSGLATILREHRTWRLELRRGADTRVVRTATLFVGNNRLQLAQLGLPEAAALQHGLLGAVMVKPTGRLALIAAALRGALGRLGDAPNVDDFAFERLTVRPARDGAPQRLKVALDGEVLWMRSPLVFSASPQPLRLLVPASADAPAPPPGAE